MSDSRTKRKNLHLKQAEYVFCCVGQPRGKLFRRNIDTLLRNKEIMVADLIQDAAECIMEEVLDRRASSPPVIYPSSVQTESSTAIFKQNERDIAEMDKDEEVRNAVQNTA